LDEPDLVDALIADGQITLSQPWPGASGAADLAMHHDQHNYAVHFELPVP
jgi:hypothetical protein